MTKTIGCHLYEVARMAKLIGTGNRKVASRGLGEGPVGSPFMGTEFQFGKMKQLCRWMVVTGPWR